ncbi:MAG: glycoside hydrolase family 2 [Clostridia bacterium]|nr:glycoside hydrolase family 2 [Clostridia bacterium]
MKHTKCYIPEYPRPQFVRSDWTNLNGEWAFAFGEEVTEAEALKGNLSRVINVPFSYETKLSGIADETSHKTVWYSKSICGKKGKRAILHFDGADYQTTVWINGKRVGEHVGAYARFSFDVTKYLTKAENLLVVRCVDPDHPAQVRGKQRWEKENFGCWYVQTTGIYKTVWMEYVEDVYLTALKITPVLQDYSVRFDVSVNAPSEDVEVRFDVSFNGKRVQTACVCVSDLENSVSVRLNSDKLTYQAEVWGMNHPNLYDVDVTVYKGGKLVDSVGSYFGLREFKAKDGQLLLNNQPYYLRLVLDQGYWPESGITPPSEEALVKDIELCKAMGFNGARKHQKVEDERFFYYADVMGYAVWCELPSNHWVSDDASCAITKEWLEIVRQNYNHPSLLTWVIFNESWGVRNIAQSAEQQNLATGLYYLTKSIDPVRPVVSNDGWVHAKSDILSLHHYEQNGEKLFSVYDSIEKLTEGKGTLSHFLPFAEGYCYEGQPIVMSEFGGTAYVRDEANGWGYGIGVKDDTDYLNRFGGLIRAIEKMNISGYCYTQVTDVEQEVNGLLYPDRSPKVPLEEIAKRNGK